MPHSRVGVRGKKCLLIGSCPEGSLTADEDFPARSAGCPSRAGTKRKRQQRGYFRRSPRLTPETSGFPVLHTRPRSVAAVRKIPDPARLSSRIPIKLRTSDEGRRRCHPGRARQKVDRTRGRAITARGSGGSGHYRPSVSNFRVRRLPRGCDVVSVRGSTLSFVRVAAHSAEGRERCFSRFTTDVSASAGSKSEKPANHPCGFRPGSGDVRPR